MKTNELLKLLKKNGCSLIRHGSNHDIWYSSVTGLVVFLDTKRK